MVEGIAGVLENSQLDMGFTLKTSEALCYFGVWCGTLSLMVKCCPGFYSLSPSILSKLHRILQQKTEAHLLRKCLSDILKWHVWSSQPALAWSEFGAKCRFLFHSVKRYEVNRILRKVIGLNSAQWQNVLHLWWCHRTFGWEGPEGSSSGLTSLLFPQLYWGPMTNKNCIYLTCTMLWCDMHMHYEMIPRSSLSTYPLPHLVTNCVCVCWGNHLRSLS